MNRILERIKKLKELVTEDEKPPLEDDPVQLLLERQTRDQNLETVYDMEPQDSEPEISKLMERSQRKTSATQIITPSDDPLMQLIQEIPEEPENSYKPEKPAARVLKSFKVMPADPEVSVDSVESIAEPILDQAISQDEAVQDKTETEPSEPATSDISEPEELSMSVSLNTANTSPQPGIKDANIPPVPEKPAPPAAVKTPENKDKKTNDLLDIFREEEKEDKGPITEGLENVNSSSLVDEAKGILEMIKNRRKH